MTVDHQIAIALERRPVTLHYPGAEGVQFHDAVLVMTNRAGEGVADVGLNLRVSQDGKILMDGAVDAEAFSVASQMGAGETVRLSVFRVLQHHVKGFGSKVNMFGYKAVLNWSFRVEASLTAGQERQPAGAWTVEWKPSASDPALVEVEIAPV